MSGLSQAQRIRARAELYHNIRAFMIERDVIEVDVPLLGLTGTTDPGIHSVTAQVNAQQRYLQTSPEFYLKRLLSQYPEAMYSLGKAFRDEERGRFHRPEFTMLEWYRPDMSINQLALEVCDLLRCVLGDMTFSIDTYQSLFESRLSINPHTVSADTLLNTVKDRIDLSGDCSRQDYLDLLMTHSIQPTLPQGQVITDYPADQSAMARIDVNAQGEAVAKRFEVYVQQIEIANGYWELTDVDEQHLRFHQDNQIRLRRGLSEMPIDPALIEALTRGLPNCSGVALGVDRLLMLLTGADHIDQVMTF